MATTILTWQAYTIAFVGGTIPSLVWLWFWLRQDRAKPEPKGLIALSFVAGMLVVYFVLPLEQLVVAILPSIVKITDAFSAAIGTSAIPGNTVQMILWAYIEEIAKYSTVFFIAFKTRYFDEPGDAIIYLITAALGFAAMENALYIFKDLANCGVADLLGNGNMRFLGATIVHTVSSAFIGIAIAYSFYASRYIKKIAEIIGVLTASLLHAYFNLSIIYSDTTLKTLLMFLPFWAAIIIIIVLLALVKRLPKPTNQ